MTLWPPVLTLRVNGVSVELVVQGAVVLLRAYIYYHNVDVIREMTIIIDKSELLGYRVDEVGIILCDIDIALCLGLPMST